MRQSFVFELGFFYQIVNTESYFGVTVQVSEMLEKSGESSDTDIEIVGEVIVTTSNETKAQVEVTNKVGNPPTTPTITVDPRMSDKMPPTSYTK